MGLGRVRSFGRSPGDTLVLSPACRAGSWSPVFLDLFAVSMSCGANFRLAGRLDDSSCGFKFSFANTCSISSSWTSSTCLLLCLVVVSIGSGANLRLAFGVPI